MYYLDLFAGIGGFALGAKWAGFEFEKTFFSEIDPYCIASYAQNFPGSIYVGDITTFDASKLPNGGWTVTGGFPCQDISVAGKGAGLDGARSGLWFTIPPIRGQSMLIMHLTQLNLNKENYTENRNGRISN